MEKENKIIQIVPALPPHIDGVGDYACNLANELQKSGIHTVFISYKNCDSTDFDCYNLNLKTSKLVLLLKSLSIQKIFVNYVSYGYHKRGIPLKLLFKLIRLKKHGFKIYCFFHEFIASGKIYHSSFWLKPLQRYIGFMILKLSEHSFCSTEFVFSILKSKSPKVYNIGIFSNINPITKPINWQNRQNFAIIFGSLQSRQKVYNSESLLKVCQQTEIEKIIDIGPGVIEYPTEIKIEKMGVRSHIEISQMLASAKWGIINYRDLLIDKSGIFAAYAAHGIAVINLYGINEVCKNDKQSTVKNLYLSLENFDLAGNVLSCGILEWYKNKTLENHTSFIKNKLFNQ